jgi:UDP-glucose 4-epimerase
MKVLVTGGAGYIGSHLVRQLGEAGHEIVVYDNLSTGHRWAVLYGELVEADLADEETLERTLQQGFDAVVHFAAHIVVPESISEPARYYGNNTRNTLALITAAACHGVEHFVFSSTAAVYGLAETVPVPEIAPLDPINPYGASKMMSERMLMDIAAASGMRYASLRYFNVAGADPHARMGQATPEATHLIKVACEAAVGKRQGVTIFGTDYATLDGTCIRDYVHVEDLARAHLDALDYLADGGESTVLNCGYGHGYSVREVLQAVEAASGQPLAIEEGARREGDPPELVAGAERIRHILRWQPQYNDLHQIVATALAWERQYAALQNAVDSTEPQHHETATE